LVKQRGRADFAPLTRRRVCRIELEINEIDLTVIAYDELADMLAGFAAASPLRIEGRLEMAQWDTGDGMIHQRLGIQAEKIHVAT